MDEADYHAAEAAAEDESKRRREGEGGEAEGRKVGDAQRGSKGSCCWHAGWVGWGGGPHASAAAAEQL